MADQTEVRTAEREKNKIKIPPDLTWIYDTVVPMQKTPCDCTVCREIEKPKVIFERGEEARIPVRRSKEISTHFFALLAVTAQL